MKALVIYESMFGNTRQVAEAVAEGMGGRFDVTVTEVGGAPRQVPDDVAILVVGGPTHAFGMSRARTRESAGTQGADRDAASHGGIREWISTVQVPERTAVATFDTKVTSPRLPGSAASSAQRRLRHRGLVPAARPETFYVTGTAGHLDDGELDRAKAWGSTLAS